MNSFDTILIILVSISFAGFVFGLAGKAIAVNKKLVRMGEVSSTITAISLVLMFLFAILWKVLT